MKKFLFSGIIACLIGFCFSCTTTEDSAGLQMRAGLPNFNYKIQKNEPVSVVFWGGSITNHQGYRVQITDWLKQQYSNVQFTSINSGIGGPDPIWVCSVQNGTCCSIIRIWYLSNLL